MRVIKARPTLKALARCYNEPGSDRANDLFDQYGMGDMYGILEDAAKLGLATWVVAVVPVVAVSVAVRALITGRHSQREATAKSIYRDYLKLAFENPNLAKPPPERKDELKQDEKYRWFVAFMLNSCDEIALSTRGNPAWRKVIFEDLKSHKEYLMSPQFREDGGWPLYSPELKDIWKRGS